MPDGHLTLIVRPDSAKSLNSASANFAAARLELAGGRLHRDRGGNARPSPQGWPLAASSMRTAKRRVGHPLGTAAEVEADPEPDARPIAARRTTADAADRDGRSPADAFAVHAFGPDAHLQGRARAPSGAATRSLPLQLLFDRGAVAVPFERGRVDHRPGVAERRGADRAGAVPGAQPAGALAWKRVTSTGGTAVAQPPRASAAAESRATEMGRVITASCASKYGLAMNGLSLRLAGLDPASIGDGAVGPRIQAGVTKKRERGFSRRPPGQR